jgi:hypothetical protein
MLRALGLGKVSASAVAVAGGVVLAVVAAVPAAALPTGQQARGGGVPGRRVGAAPVVPGGARVLGAVPASAPLAFDIVLGPRDPAGLGRLAASVSTPGSADYRRFLTTARFAARFGQPHAVIAGVDAALRGVGLPAGRVTANHLVIPVATTVGRASAALHTQFERYRLASGGVAFANTSAPQLPAVVAKVTQSVVGLNNLVTVAPAPPAPSARARLRAPRRRVVRAASGPQPCPAAVTAASQSGAWTYDQLAGAYSVSGLYGKGINGNGVTIALFELQPWSASDIGAFQSCYGTNAPVTTVPVDGGATGSDGSEATLDIETTIAMAPGASVQVYEAPASDYALSTIDEYAQIVIPDQAAVLSISYGICEQFVNQTYPGLIASENTLFEEAAAEGMSVLAASGDTGSEGCERANGGTQLGVLDPASQPYVTSVGGTDLTAAGPPPAETVWNETAAQEGAGGGGVSSVWRMPSWQRGPGVISQYSSSIPCEALTGYRCREVPDVSASADPAHGYVIYYGGNWTVYGGTSAAAPLWTALAADTGSLTSPPTRLGFLNPLLYSEAAGTLNDVTSGNNDYTQTHNGLYPATSGYDLATGLGTPNTAALADIVLPRSWGTATEVPGIAALNTGGGAQVSSLSCASAGNCTAGGSYIDGSGHYQVFVADEVNGTWGNAIEVPGTAALNAGSYAAVTSVSCASAGNCTAGGRYSDASNDNQAFVADEVNGTWGTAIEVPGTAAQNVNGDAEVDSVSCGSPGNCTAGGLYYDGSGFQAFVADEVNGTWGTAIEVPGTAALNAGLNADVTSVSCASAGNCSASGEYADYSGGIQVFVVSEVNGTWGNAIEVPGTAALNAGRWADVTSVSCASADNCTAGGTYSKSPAVEQAFVADEVNGTWGTAIEVPGIAALNTRGYAQVNSVSCGSAGNCSAVGVTYYGGSSDQAFVADEVNGTWGKAIEVPGTGGNAGANSVSCLSAGNCSAGGADYGGAWVADEANGIWGTAIELPGAAGGTTNAVSCVPGGGCSAGGEHAAQAFVVSQNPVPNSATALNLSTFTVTYGNEQVEKVSVMVSSGGTATGTVLVQAGTTTLCTIMLSSGTGSCTLQPTALPAGTYQVTGSYSGDANTGPSVSPPQTLTVAG